MSLSDTVGYNDDFADIIFKDGSGAAAETPATPWIHFVKAVSPHRLLQHEVAGDSIGVFPEAAVLWILHALHGRVEEEELGFEFLHMAFECAGEIVEELEVGGTRC